MNLLKLRNIRSVARRAGPHTPTPYQVGPPFPTCPVPGPVPGPFPKEAAESQGRGGAAEAQRRHRGSAEKTQSRRRGGAEKAQRRRRGRCPESFTNHQPHAPPTTRLQISTRNPTKSPPEPPRTQNGVCIVSRVLVEGRFKPASENRTNNITVTADTNAQPHPLLSISVLHSRRLKPAGAFGPAGRGAEAQRRRR